MPLPKIGAIHSRRPKVCAECRVCRTAARAYSSIMTKVVTRGSRMPTYVMIGDEAR